MLSVLAQSVSGSGGPFAGLEPDEAAKWAMLALVIGGPMLLGLVGMIVSAVRRSSETRAKEESRREIAAYVAEGSMSVADAERLMNAGKKRGGSCCSKDA